MPLRMDDFVGHARRIRKAYRAAQVAESAAKRAGEPSLRPANCPEGVLHFECYRYFRALKRKGMLEALAAHVAGDPRSRWRRHQREGVDNVLRLLERPGKRLLITPSRRGRVVKELELADRYDIHSKLLVAFLYEAGPHQRMRKIDPEKPAEPWIVHYQNLSNFFRDDAAKRRAAASSSSDAPA